MYPLDVYRYSYWELGGLGAPILDDNGRPTRKEGMYKIDHWITPEQTALIIMDPWDDMPDDNLNEIATEIICMKILPLAEAAARVGHPVYIMTNDPDTVEYSKHLDIGLLQLERNNQADILYHSDNDGFISALVSSNINRVIYTGFHSNSCVLNRPSGIVAAHNAGLTTYLVPEASAAVERKDTWQTGAVHKLVCEMVLSFGQSYLIHYNDLMKAMADGR